MSSGPSVIEQLCRDAIACRGVAPPQIVNPRPSYLWPKLCDLARDQSDIQIEIANDYGLTNIVERRVDIGVRLGDQVEKDMIAVRVAPDGLLPHASAVITGRAARGRSATVEMCLIIGTTALGQNKTSLESEGNGRATI